MPELRRAATHLGLEVVEVFEEQLSAAKHRPVYERMKRHASRGAFNVIIVWAIDRLGRSMLDVALTVQALDSNGCRIASVKEPWLDSRGPMRQLLIAIFGWIAEQERARIIERTQAGIARARAEGIALGRPRVAFDVGELAKLAAEGLSIRKIAAQLNAKPSTVARWLRSVPKSSGADAG